jgi:small subunit ribosomal protein S12e
LGDWIGLCKFLNVAKKIKARKCSSLVIKDFAIEISENERNLIEDKIKTL